MTRKESFDKLLEPGLGILIEIPATVKNEETGIEVPIINLGAPVFLELLENEKAARLG